jgi:hypothetical protein
MSRNTQEYYAGNCKDCDYEFWSNSIQAAKIMKRLHKKVCKMDGRTEQPAHKKRAFHENKVFAKVVSSTTGIFAGKNKKATMTQLKEQQDYIAIKN